MKTIGIINFCVALLLTIVLNGVRPESITKVLDNMAVNGTLINGILKPSRNGTIGHSGFGSIYKGHLVSLDNREVAMKVIPFEKMLRARVEYIMYTYLNAIDDQIVEAYGIPAIYYFDKWNDYNHTVMAMTLLDSTFEKKFEAGEFNELDLLTVFREFVKTIKYIHSRGIVHHRIMMQNMIIEDGQVFIFDFGSSLDMDGRTRETFIKSAKGDFRDFLQSFFYYFRRCPIWQRLGLDDNDKKQLTRFTSFVAKLEEDAKTNDGNRFTGVKRVFLEFHKHAYDNHATHTTGITDTNGTLIPFYDHLYRVVIEEMKMYGRKARLTTPSISYIADPFGPHVSHAPRPYVP